MSKEYGLEVSLVSTFILNLVRTLWDNLKGYWKSFMAQRSNYLQFVNKLLKVWKERFENIEDGSNYW